MAKFDNNDDSVVVVIGSGAGGGTLANELCGKGIPDHVSFGVEFSLRSKPRTRRSAEGRPRADVKS